MGSIRRDIEINPLFPLPPGVIDVRQEYNESTTSTFDEAEVVVADSEMIPADVILNPLIPTVTSMSITKQEIRFTTDGRAVVDVTASFPVSDDVIELQVQLTKT